jgi:hypothetical protein
MADENLLSETLRVGAACRRHHALRFPQRAFHQAENWVERAGDLNPTLTTIHLKGGGFKPLFFVNRQWHTPLKLMINPRRRVLHSEG